MSAIHIRDLRKEYAGFCLDIPELVLEEGYVYGLIGDNGSGKTTLFRCLAGAAIIDDGSIEIDREKPIGAVFDECPFQDEFRMKDLSSIFSHLFPDWDDEQFRRYMASFNIDPKKQVKSYSRGMRMKAQIAVALSHPTDILMLDEPTAGMDPGSREEFLDVVRDYITDENRMVLISSHITTDIERIADFIIFLKDGKVILFGEKDAILEKYAIAHVPQDMTLGGDLVVAVRKMKYEDEYLIKDKAAFSVEHPDISIDPASLEDIMLIISKGVSL